MQEKLPFRRPQDTLSIAPMLDCTDRHYRYLMRLITKHTLLYTEMLTIKEVLENKGGRRLELHPFELPVAIQLGGSHAAQLAQCARLAMDAGYCEINLNVGCPSHRVQCGGIGACLMLQPMLVADCVAAMQSATPLPVTIKCRLGVDEFDAYDHLHQFISTVSQAGCQKFVIHARKAWLQGLSPKQNRELPLLDYGKVYQIKQDLPQLRIIINGGIKTHDQVTQHLQQVDGVMIGRAAYENPLLFSEVDHLFYHQEPMPLNVEEVVHQYIAYANEELGRGTRLSAMTRHLLNLFTSRPRARLWRRYLSCNSAKQGAGIEVIQAALSELNIVA
jgi:tRNA-dihydrouridine synthase A